MNLHTRNPLKKHFLCYAFISTLSAFFFGAHACFGSSSHSVQDPFTSHDPRYATLTERAFPTPRHMCEPDTLPLPHKLHAYAVIALEEAIIMHTAWPEQYHDVMMGSYESPREHVVSDLVLFLQRRGTTGTRFFTHLEIHADALDALIAHQDAPKILQENAGLVSLALYGQAGENTHTALRYFPYLKRLELSKSQFLSWTTPTLITCISHLHALQSFTAPDQLYEYMIVNAVIVANSPCRSEQPLCEGALGHYQTLRELCKTINENHRKKNVFMLTMLLTDLMSENSQDAPSQP